MKYMFASDIHGSASAMRKTKDIFLCEKADYLVLCGDLLYHGPRNDLPDEYNPKAVIEILNSLFDKIIAVRGNCDSEVDQMVLNFPMLCDYTLIFDGIRMYVTHGHIYNQENPMKLSKGDFMISGHTHVLKCLEENGVTYLNPGSVSIPKENNPPSYMIYEDSTFKIKDLDGNIIKEYNVNVTKWPCYFIKCY